MRLQMTLLLVALQAVNSQLTCKVQEYFIGPGIQCYKSTTDSKNIYTNSIHEETISNQMTSADQPEIVKVIKNEIKVIDLNDCGIESIEPEAFHNLEKLERVDLTKNNLTILHNTTFTGAKGVMTLNLDSNRLSTIEEDTFKPLPLLYELKLSHNKLKGVSERMLTFNSKLVIFEIDHNEISELPEGLFRNSKDLRVIDLSNNELSSLPSKIFEGLNVLASLRLDDCQFKVLPSAIRSANVHSLNMSSNAIEIVPEGYFDELTTLHELDMSKNMISLIDEYTFKKSALMKLDLSHNNISDAKWMVHLDSIWYINVQHNNFKNIGTVFPAKLNKLFMVGNPFECKCYNETSDVLERMRIRYDWSYFDEEKYKCIDVDEAESSCKKSSRSV